jgi:hypothetical protein
MGRAHPNPAGTRAGQLNRGYAGGASIHPANRGSLVGSQSREIPGIGRMVAALMSGAARRGTAVIARRAALPPQPDPAPSCLPWRGHCWAIACQGRAGLDDLGACLDPAALP